MAVPTIFNLLVTNKCNFDCSYCFFTSNENQKSIDVDRLVKPLIEAKRLGIKHIIFTGGEPLVHERFDDLLRNCYRLGFYTYLNTNGWYFDSFSDSFKKYGLTEAIFGLDGSEAKVHDAVRGKKGSFKRVMDGFHLAKELGLYTGLIYIVQPENLHDLESFMELAVKLRPDELLIRPVSPGGRANDKKFMLTPDESEYAHNIVSRYIGVMPKNSISSPFSAPRSALTCPFIDLTKINCTPDAYPTMCSALMGKKEGQPNFFDNSFLDCISFWKKEVTDFMKKNADDFLKWKPERRFDYCAYCIERNNR